MIDSSPDGRIEDCSLSTCEHVLLVLAIGPEVSASVELRAVGGVGIVTHPLTTELTLDHVQREQESRDKDGDTGSQHCV